MALDHFLLTNFPSPIVGGVKGPLIVTAYDASGNVQTGYTGTVQFSSSDPGAQLPANYTFTGTDAGVHVFFAVLKTPGVQSITASDLTAGKSGDVQITVIAKPAGWGLDPFGITPYGSSELGVGISLVSAVALSTHEVQVNLNVPPLATSPSVIGDALNPSTWIIQRTDTGFTFHAVDVVAISPTSYGVYTLEPFAPVNVQHQISSVSLLDAAHNPLVPPRSALFAGVVDASLNTNTAFLSSRRIASTDLANVQSPTAQTLTGGTLLVDASGDYKTVTGARLVQKLILRRLITKPGEFFHLPNYGIGFQVKQRLPSSDLVKLKQRIESQVLLEPEVSSTNAVLTLDNNGDLTLQLTSILKSTGEPVVVTVPELLQL